VVIREGDDADALWVVAVPHAGPRYGRVRIS